MLTLASGPMGIQTPASIDAKSRFTRESQQYTPLAYLSPQQEEKRCKRLAAAKRLENIRMNEKRVIDAHAHVREAHEKAQARRINTLIGHRAQRFARQMSKNKT